MTLQRFVSIFLIGLMVNFSFLHSPVAANSREEKNILKVKSAINKLGEGREALVKIRLKDKKTKRLRGSIRNESFTVVNETANITSEVKYESVRQVQGRNRSTGTGAAVAIAIGVAVIIGIIIAISWD